MTEPAPAPQAPSPQAPSPQAPSLATLTPEAVRARSKRNLAIAIGLAAFMVLVFIVTLVRIKDQVAASVF